MTPGRAGFDPLLRASMASPSRIRVARRVYASSARTSVSSSILSVLARRRRREVAMEPGSASLSLMLHAQGHGGSKNRQNRPIGLRQSERPRRALMTGGRRRAVMYVATYCFACFDYARIKRAMPEADSLRNSSVFSTTRCSRHAPARVLCTSSITTWTPIVFRSNAAAPSARCRRGVRVTLQLQPGSRS